MAISVLYIYSERTLTNLAFFNTKSAFDVPLAASISSIFSHLNKQIYNQLRCNENEHTSQFVLGISAFLSVDFLLEL